jgi:hypothetical protein
MEKTKAQPLHFEGAYLAHFPLDLNVFYKFGCTKWRNTIFKKNLKATNHG